MRINLKYRIGEAVQTLGGDGTIWRIHRIEINASYPCELGFGHDYKNFYSNGSGASFEESLVRKADKRKIGSYLRRDLKRKVRHNVCDIKFHLDGLERAKLALKTSQTKLRRLK